MQKAQLFVAALCVLIVSSMSLAVAAGDITVGAKKGDYIQYMVSETGDVAPDYNITWARMDVTAVEGTKITVDVQTGYANGTLYPEPQIPLDLATGAVGDGFFVPTNLNVGDQFYSEYQGNITVTSTWQMQVCGQLRTIISATTNQTTYYWDRQTGVLVGATTVFPTFTLFTRTSQTNLWQPQIFGLDSTVFYLIISLVIAVLVVLIATIAILAQRLKVQRNPK